MNRKEFVEYTLFKFEDDLFFELKELFIKRELISFNFYSFDFITKELFAEKLLDYFEKVEINTSKSFEKLLEAYASNLDSVISGKVAKEHKPNKKNPVHILPRARRYYDKAISMKKIGDMQSLVDFSRIMMCLYMEIMSKNGEEIDEINYAFECLDINKIIDSLQKEQNNLLKLQKFNLKNPYGDDFFTFVLVTIVYYHIKNNG